VNDLVTGSLLFGARTITLRYHAPDARDMPGGGFFRGMIIKEGPFAKAVGVKKSCGRRLGRKFRSRNIGKTNR
jgi:hypothetical protein